MTVITDSPPFVAGVAPFLAELEQALTGEFAAYSPLLAEAAGHLLEAGGKRLRPVLVLWSAASTGGIQPGHRVLAQAVELLHTATLIHDDILDDALLRRGRPTVAANWGQKVAVIAGDFLLARSSLLVSELGLPELNALYARTVMEMCEGEIRQQVHRHQSDLGTYLDVIERKTAILMAAGCQGAAMLNGAPANEIQALRAFGLALGKAFQVIDDVLDFTGDSRDVGKGVRADLAGGYWTAPVLFAMEETPALAKLLSTGQEPEKAWGLVAASSGVDRATALARAFAEEARQALHVLAEGEGRAALGEIADFVLARRH